MNRSDRTDDTLTIPIRRFVTKRLIAVDHNSTIQESAARMVEFDISSLGVLENERVVGIVTDTDLKQRALASGRSTDDPVYHIMTRELITADINSTVQNVLQLMSKNKIKHILVTDRDEVVGVTTMKDLEDLDIQGLETLISRD